MAEDRQPQRYLPSWDVLIGERFKEEIEQVAIEERDVENARKERTAYQSTTLEQLELHWRAEFHWTYRWVIGPFYKGQYLEEILNDPKQRVSGGGKKPFPYEELLDDEGNQKKKEHNHELCQVELGRYDLHQAQVRVGEHLLALYVELRKVVKGLERYQNDLQKNEQEIERYRARLGEIQETKDTTKQEVALLQQVCGYLQRYDALSVEERQKLAEIFKTHQPTETASLLSLENTSSRGRLAQQIGDLIKEKERRLTNALNRKKSVGDGMARSEARNSYLCTQLEAHYDRFDEMLDYASRSREKFDNLKSEKQVPLLNPKAPEMVREAEAICSDIERLFERHQETSKVAAEQVTHSIDDPEGIQKIISGEERNL